MFDFEDLDHYELLGVPRAASAEDIKRAYRREISKYHPDRFGTASPDEQVYAERRSQRLSESYRTLSDFSARTAYNRSLPSPAQPRAASTREKVDDLRAQPRDRQAELYDQAKVHLEQGRTAQALAALRQLQQINPFYRDSAELLAQTEAQSPRRAGGDRRRPLLIGGGVAGATVVALAAWGLARRGTPPTSAPEPTPVIAVANVATTAAPTTAPTLAGPMLPAPTVRAAVVTSTPEPSATPELSPTPAVPTPAARTSTPLVETGPVVLADGFTGTGWADIAGNGWSVGYQNEQYRVTAIAGAGNIWSYRSGAPTNASIGVDVRVLRGSGGMLLRFTNEQTYMNFNIDAQGNYVLEQHSGGSISALAGGQSAALLTGPNATNRLVARMRGNNVQISANGQTLATVDTSGVPASRRYGLLAVGGASESDVLFDNVEIRALEAGG